tara:strand:- start:300 stop:1133 length:834 start_codon:yes stop_codon:yes gene_type:complete
MVEKVSAGATGALGNISMKDASGNETYDYTDLSGMMEKIQTGATGALGYISMTDANGNAFDPDNVSHLTTKIKSGGSGALGDIRMTGFDHDNSSSWSTFTSAFSTAYDGTYNSVCPSNKKLKETLVLSGTSFKKIQKDYNANGCATGDREGEHVSYYTFVLGDNVTVTKNSDNSSVSAQKITKTKTKHTYMFMKDSDVIGANSGSACGFSDWEVNVAKDVSSVVGPSGCPTSDAIGTVYKTVILMIGSNLWMGDNDNGSTDSDNFYSRIKDTGFDKE